MHVLFRESHGLEEGDTPVDLGQSPAEMIVLSFSDSDLGAFADGARRAVGNLPSLRLANLAALRHPLSVDTYLANTLRDARAVLVRLIGGESYWSYGIQEVAALAREKGIALAVLPADGREDARLDALSTVPVADLRRLAALCDAGGAGAARAALHVLAGLGGLADMPEAAEVALLPDAGWYDPGHGLISPPAAGRDVAVVVFYRSYLTSADTEPVDALISAMRAQGLAAFGLFAPSLKADASARWIAAEMARLQPVAILNATAFSARDSAGVSPLDAGDCPVFQVALSTARRADWAASTRGLSPADLAMHVVLPEVDGRLFAGVVSFKSETVRDPAMEFSCLHHGADAERIAAVAGKVLAWQRLRRTPAVERDIALVLSTYPGKAHQAMHAVGLDVPASCAAILDRLASAGYGLSNEVFPADIVGLVSGTTVAWPVEAYRAACAALPPALQAELAETWGDPEADPAVHDGAFHFAARSFGKVLVALQPERGEAATRDASYHDTSRVPCHGYVAFYLMLAARKLHAMVHVGAHGTLEWLPGKAVAQSAACWPEALAGAMPVLYPFIVNDPGEAAQAKRRLGAVTLGHLPPPLAASAVPEGLLRLERLLDEFSTADGLDPARRDRLIASIREEAQASGVESDLGLSPAATPAEALLRIDRFVCDIKESQYGDGLHVFGRGACGEAELDGLLTALDGRRVPAGPSGSPHRGRSDVLPTGRNLYSVDPRAVPSRVAHAQGVRLAEELLRRHLQDHGDWPTSVVVDLWGSASMRTAGEEFAMALHLAGLAPRWDAGSERVAGFDILPPALVGRPRIDVTLRVSGLFRDVFPGLAQMFQTACDALAARMEEGGENPYLARMARVFGPRPGQYGVGMGQAMDSYAPGQREEAGAAWLAGSSWAVGADGRSSPERAALEARVRAADGFVHVQDLPETDLLLHADYAAHEGGFAAARHALGVAPIPQYHLDATVAGRPRARLLPEEIARIVRARASQPGWADGMMRHGFRGAAEIAATLDHLAAFAHLAGAVSPHLFDLYFEATLGRPEVVAFMARENAGALAALRARFAALREAGLWITRRNSIPALLEASE